MKTSKLLTDFVSWWSLGFFLFQSLDEKPSDLKDDPQEKTSDKDLKKIISGKLKKEKDDGDIDDKSIRM